MIQEDSLQIDIAVAKLDAWLETMRGPGGYGGPVTHWRKQSFVYTGFGLDWRYEGIIIGYLQLWKRTGGTHWLAKARRAGDDLVAGQMENGHFAASVFEANISTAGTPHEAACDVGLLLLALELRNAGYPDWQSYAACAQRNLQTFYIGQLWDDGMRVFRDSQEGFTFVPSKAATVCEALFLLAEITDQEKWVEQYALPTINRILAYQVQNKGPLDGAIAYNSVGLQIIEKYFPLYSARCVAALLRGYRWSNKEVYADSALRVMQFFTRWVYPDGSFPVVIYPNLRVNRYPSWIAPLGDILHAVHACRSYGFSFDFCSTLQYLLDGQDETGGIQTAKGFAAHIGGRLSRVPDVRDVLHVVGWCDKAFRYLASHTTGAPLAPAKSNLFETECTFLGKKMYFAELNTCLEIVSKQGTSYRWLKGALWPEVISPEFWLR